MPDRIEEIRRRHHGVRPDAIYVSFVTPQDTSDLFIEIDRLRAGVGVWERIWDDAILLAARVEALRDGTAQRA